MEETKAHIIIDLQGHDLKEEVVGLNKKEKQRLLLQDDFQRKVYQEEIT